MSERLPVSIPVLFFASLSVLGAAVYFSFALWAARSAQQGSARSVFVLMNLGLGVWSLLVALLVAAPSGEAAMTLYRLSCVFWVPLPALLLHFLLSVSGERPLRRRPWLSVPIYLPAAVFLALTPFGALGVVGFEASVLGWVEIWAGSTPWWNGFVVYGLCFPLIGLGVALYRAWRARDPGRWAQTLWITLPGPPVLAAILAVGWLLPSLGVLHVPEVSHLVPLIWLAGFARAISSHQLLSITPAVAGREVLDTMAEAVLVVDRRRQVMMANRAAGDLFERPRRDLLHLPIATIFPGEVLFGAESVREMLAGHRIRGLEFSLTSHQGESRWLSVSSSSLSDRYDRPAALVLVLQDVSERRRAEEQLRFSATHDSLTRLANRTVFMDRLVTATAQAARRRGQLAVFMIDLDRFKSVNDTLGHGAGDQLLTEVAERLTASVREVDTVARLGGDEFAVVLPEVAGPKATEMVAERILASVAQLFRIREEEVRIGCSVGIALFPRDGKGPEDLLKHADLALYEAKEAGGATLRFFSPDVATAREERMEIEKGLRSAVGRQELFLLYQPIVELASGRIASVEALLRWRHPRMGVIPPASFLTVAESTGDILEIGAWVLREACTQSQRWKHQGLGNVVVAVNLSTTELCRPELPATVAGILRETGLDPKWLELEFDEQAVLEDLDLARSVLEGLHELGCRLTVDEFDAGYAALRRLRSLPIDAVKVSRLFMRDIDDPREGAVLMAMVAMAHNLGVEVVVEGVEREGQLRYLRDLEWNFSLVSRCDRAQGHLFSEAVAADEIPGLFDRADEIRRLAGSA